MSYESVTPSLAKKKVQDVQVYDGQRTNQTRVKDKQTAAYRDNSGVIQARRTAKTAPVRSQKMQAVTHTRRYHTGNWEHIDVHTQSIAGVATAIKWRKRSILAIRILFGCFWALDAYFKWQPGFGNNFIQYFAASMNGQAPGVAVWLTFWLHLANLNPLFCARAVALAETCIALCLIFGAFTNLACGAGILLSLLSWSALYGLGGLLGRGTLDIGVIIVYIFVFAGLILSNAGQVRGVDRSLASKLGNWTFLTSGPVKQ